MKKVKLIALFAALVLGLASYQFLKEISKPVEIPRTKVIVAAVDIPENTQISAEMLQYKMIATESLLPGYLQDPSSVLGKVLKSDVYAGEMITENRLVALGEAVDNSSLEYVLEPGMRAFTMSVSLTNSQFYMVKPGNRVDLILLYTKEEKRPGQEEPDQVPTATFGMQNLLILAVNNSLSKSGLGEYSTFTLQVSPEEALRLSLIDGSGVVGVKFLLRSALDEEIIEEITMDIDDIIDRY